MSKSQEIIIELKATPEEVFRAITDPEQIVKWFAPESRVDPRVGGDYYFSWGPGMEATTTISTFDPPTHFGTARERSVAYGKKGPVDTGVMQNIAVDYYIEAMEGGMTRLRLVQSGFGPEAAWDEEFESSKKGWGEFLAKLKEVVEG